MKKREKTLKQEISQLQLEGLKGWGISNGMWKLIPQKGTIYKKEYLKAFMHDCLQNRVKLWDLVQEALVKFK